METVGLSTDEGRERATRGKETTSPTDNPRRQEVREEEQGVRSHLEGYNMFTVYFGRTDTNVKCKIGKVPLKRMFQNHNCQYL